MSSQLAPRSGVCYAAKHKKAHESACEAEKTLK